MLAEPMMLRTAGILQSSKRSCCFLTTFAMKLFHMHFVSLGLANEVAPKLAKLVAVECWECGKEIRKGEGERERDRERQRE